jgi:hypothetical protein
MAKFHHYSPLNKALISLQRPDATFVKGRRQWVAQDRTVKRGARAIQIIAPTLGAGDRSPVIRFTTAKVYDVSDTDGPPFAVPALTPDTRGQEELVGQRLSQLIEWVHRSGLRLRFEAPAVNELIDGATDGSSIWIRPDVDDATKLLILAHEIAHAKLHVRRRARGKIRLEDLYGQAPSRDTRELEAELTAFFLLELFGIDSSRGSAGYLNGWKAGREEIRQHAPKVFRAACAVVSDCERKRYRRLVEEGGVTIVGLA